MKYTHEHLVVAYGSNLCDYDLKNFARKNGFSESCIHFEDVVFLPDFELCFNTASKSRKGGVLNIRKALGCVTEAGLFSANLEGLELLRKKEGHPFKYEEVEVVALDTNGVEIKALTYVVPPQKTKGFVKPHADYLQVCEDGFNSRGIDCYNLKVAARGEKIKPNSALFTYGTLMRGEKRYDLIKEFSVECALMAQCFGSLSTNGHYPALSLDGDGFSWGDYFVSGDIVSLLKCADKIEGFVGFGSDQNLFRRTFVQVDVGRLRYAWLYVMDKNLDIDIQTNDWREYSGNRLRFVADIYRSHAEKKANLDDMVMGRLCRFGGPKDRMKLQPDQIIGMLYSGRGLAEFDLAKVTNHWVANTN